jgi:ABC-type dipeptide/oligopeptide/nickel transport system permease subunit
MRPTGILCAVKRGTWVDTLVTSLANAGSAVPIFLLAIILVYILALRLGWLPVQGYVSPFEDFRGNLERIVMPVMCLALIPVAPVCRQTRSALLGVLGQDSAPSKGPGHRGVTLRHALKKSLTPIVTASGMTLGAILGWTVLVETIFNIPSIGRLAFVAVENHDYPFLQGVVLVVAAVVLAVNLLVDLSLGWLNRRSALPSSAPEADTAAPDTIEDADAAPRAGEFARFRRAFLGRTMVKVGLVILVVFLLIGIFAPFIAPHDPNAMSDADVLLSPSWSHPLGTDGLGRDTASRFVYASRTALIVGVSAAAIAAVVGALLGLGAGFLGRWVNFLIRRVMDALTAFPLVLLALAIVALLGGGLGNVIVALSVGLVPGFVPVMRGAVLRAKDNEYALAAGSEGARRRRVLFARVFRNCLKPFAVLMITMVGAVVLVESGLSFLGIGISESTATWGSMVFDGRQYLLSNPVLALAPGLALMLVVFAFNMVGDGLRDTLDPRVKGTI